MNQNQSQIGKINSNDELVMIKFVALSLILFVRNYCITYLVTNDISQILKRLTKFPPIEDILYILQLTNQCKEFLFSGNEDLRPKFPVLNIPHKEKGLNLTNIKKTGVKLLKKMKKSDIAKLLKPKKHEDNIDLTLISVTKQTENSDLHTNKALNIINQVSSNIQSQIHHRALDITKVEKSINLLKELKNILDNESSLNLFGFK